MPPATSPFPSLTEEAQRFLDEPVRAAAYVLPRGEYARTIPLVFLGAIGAAIVAASSRKPRNGKLPRNMLLAVTDTKLVLMSVKRPTFGRLQVVGQHIAYIPFDGIHVVAEKATMTYAITITRKGESVKLEALRRGPNRPIAETVEILTSLG